MDVESATRVIQWNVSPAMVWVMYLSLAVAVVVFALGSWWRARPWFAVGRPTPPPDRIGRRLLRVLRQATAQRLILRKARPGAAHVSFTYGFLVLGIATVVVWIDHSAGIPIMRGPFYLYFQSLAVDSFGVIAAIALAYFLIRRIAARSRPVLETLYLAAALLLLVTGYVIEGLRIAATNDPWAAWSPFGAATGAALTAIFGAVPLRSMHAAMWVFHVALWHSLLALIPFTRLRHVVLAPLGIFLADPNPTHPLERIDFAAEAPRLGIASPFDMTWKQLMDLDACTECARCQNACPAFGAGQPLSPMRVILALRNDVWSRRSALLAAARSPDRDRGPALAGNVVPSDALWACTTCRACETACPVGIEHVPLIVGLRRHEAMVTGRMPEGAADALASLEARQHPYRGATADRSKWYEGLDVPVIARLGSAEGLEFVYWVGCAVVSDQRMQNVARSFVRTLTEAGVRFAVLGNEEQCNGDPARRTGNEFHFDELAQRNVALLQRYGIRRVVTHCAHCLQTLKHDYRAYGLEAEVLHHSQVLDDLIAAGRLKVGEGVVPKVTFHDPCYLGRYNGVFAAPRNVLDKVATQRVEMADSAERSMCCGAGGGHAFYRESGYAEINARRAEQALATGASTVCTACPFCLGMMEEGLTGSGVRVRDIAEVVAEALDAPEIAK